MATELRFVEDLPHERERVWRALTDSAAITDWLMPNNFRAIVGHRFEMHTRPAPGFDGTVRCEVTVVDPPRHLAYTWVGGGIETLVTFTLESTEQGTRLTLVHSGFEGLKGWMISRILGRGWRGKILPILLPAAVGRMTDSGYVPASIASELTCAKV